MAISRTAQANITTYAASASISLSFNQQGEVDPNSSQVRLAISDR